MPSERKAAHTALRFMGSYPAEAGLVEVLSPLAREDLQHFETVVTLLKRRGWPLRLLSAPPYAKALQQWMAPQEPERMLDRLLVAGLIEARSHERLGLLAQHCPDEELAGLYPQPAGQRGAPLWSLPGSGGAPFLPQGGGVPPAKFGGNRGANPQPASSATAHAQLGSAAGAMKTTDSF